MRQETQITRKELSIYITGEEIKKIAIAKGVTTATVRDYVRGSTRKSEIGDFIMECARIRKQQTRKEAEKLMNGE